MRKLVFFVLQHAASATNQRSKMLHFDALQHFETIKYLLTQPKFPTVGKYLGWLACVAGCLELVGGLTDDLQQLQQNLLGAAGVALENAANCKENIVEQRKLLIENFYLIKILLYMNLFYNDLPEVAIKSFEKLPSFAPNLSKLSISDLKAKDKKLFSFLFYDEATIKKSLKNKYTAFQNSYLL